MAAFGQYLGELWVRVDAFETEEIEPKTVLIDGLTVEFVGLCDVAWFVFPHDRSPLAMECFLMQKTEFFALLDELFEVDPSTVTADTVLKDVPSWSSLTFVGLIAIIDEEYGIAMAPNAILSCRTAGELAERVAGGMPQQRAA